MMGRVYCRRFESCDEAILDEAGKAAAHPNCGCSRRERLQQLAHSTEASLTHSLQDANRFQV